MQKDAEGQLPQIDTKGKVLEMEEYSFSKRWFFQYKYVRANNMLNLFKGKENDGVCIVQPEMTTLIFTKLGVTQATQTSDENVGTSYGSHTLEHMERAL